MSQVSVNESQNTFGALFCCGCGGGEAEASQRGEVKHAPVFPKQCPRLVAFEEELAARRARDEAVRFEGCTVYCAKHL